MAEPVQPITRPTIKSVAERAGVSKSLVSLVMRGSPNVSEARRQAVLRAARELGYRPNAVARSLVEGRTRLVGALVADIHNPFFAEFLDGLQENLHQRGLRLLLGSGGWDETLEHEAIEAFLDLRVDALVLLSAVPRSPALRSAALAVPTVVVGEREVGLENVDIVVDDDSVGARLAVDHLVGLGHRWISHIEGSASATATARRDGYVQAMRRHRLHRYITVEPGDFTEAGGYRAAHALLRNRYRAAHARLRNRGREPRPTAIFAPNDLAAVGALSAADELGLSVPGDVSIVGYDNTHLAAIRHISLTSLDQPRHDMGRIAAELLTARIADPTGEPRRVIVVPKLVKRASTGSPQNASA